MPEAASGAARGESGGGTGSSAAVSGSNRARADELKPLKLKAGTFSQCGHAPASAKHPSKNALCPTRTTDLHATPMGGSATVEIGGEKIDQKVLPASGEQDWLADEDD